MEINNNFVVLNENEMFDTNGGGPGVILAWLLVGVVVVTAAAEVYNGYSDEKRRCE